MMVYFIERENKIWAATGSADYEFYDCTTFIGVFKNEIQYDQFDRTPGDFESLIKQWIDEHVAR
jgi:hypothetical protein